MTDSLTPDDDPLDLRAIDPDRDPAAAERFVDAVMMQLAGSPFRHPAPVDPIAGVWSLAPQFAVAASLLLVIAGAVMAQRLGAERAGPPTVVESIGVPPEFRALLAARSAAGKAGSP